MSEQEKIKLGKVYIRSHPENRRYINWQVVVPVKAVDIEGHRSYDVYNVANGYTDGWLISEEFFHRYYTMVDGFV